MPGSSPEERGLLRPPVRRHPPNNGSSARDATLNGRTGTYRNNAAHSTFSVCPRGVGGSGSTTFDGNSDYVTMPDAWANPQTFSTEVWFRTSVGQGALVGFSNSLLGLISLNYDRQVYLTSAGQLTFGAGSNVVITSPASYTDGAWHLMVATLSSAGMRLYVDGALVASGASTAAQNYTGYWRFAQNPLAGWPNAPSSTFFSGQLAWGAAYPAALTAADVAAHYAAGR